VFELNRVVVCLLIEYSPPPIYSHYPTSCYESFILIFRVRKASLEALSLKSQSVPFIGGSLPLINGLINSADHRLPEQHPATTILLFLSLTVSLVLHESRIYPRCASITFQHSTALLHKMRSSSAPKRKSRALCLVPRKIISGQCLPYEAGESFQGWPFAMRGSFKWIVGT
jgi:hypothetical protein